MYLFNYSHCKCTHSRYTVEIGRVLVREFYYAPADCVYAGGLGGIALLGCCMPGTAGAGGLMPGFGEVCGRGGGAVVPMGGGR